MKGQDMKESGMEIYDASHCFLCPPGGFSQKMHPAMSLEQLPIPTEQPIEQPTEQPIPVLNEVLLDKVLEHIDVHPELWHQGSWRIPMLNGDIVRLFPSPKRGLQEIAAELANPDCTTAFCLAGWAVELSGAHWASDDPLSSFTQYQGVLEDNELVSVQQKATKLLGLTDLEAEVLFRGDNERALVQKLVDMIKQARQVGQSITYAELQHQQHCQPDMFYDTDIFLAERYARWDLRAVRSMGPY